MIKFETINGTLCRMVEPEPLTEFSHVPCVIRRKQGVLTDILTEYSTNPTMSILGELFEIIGYPVQDGSAEWALYRLGTGDIVIGAYWGDSAIVTPTSKGWHEVIRVDLYGKRHGTPIKDNDFLFHAEKDGWQLYEPQTQPCEVCDGIGMISCEACNATGLVSITQPAKEPIANCENCKHVCTNSNIDHCHMYEPQPAYAVGDWVSDGVVQGRITYIDNEVVDVRANDDNVYTINEDNLHKLQPSEVVVDFGNGIKGTISKLDGKNQIMVFQDNFPIAWINIDYIEDPLQTLVKELLEKQEGEINGTI